MILCRSPFFFFLWISSSFPVVCSTNSICLGFSKFSALFSWHKELPENPLLVVWKPFQVCNLESYRVHLNIFLPLEAIFLHCLKSSFLKTIDLGVFSRVWLEQEKLQGGKNLVLAIPSWSEVKDLTRLILNFLNVFFSSGSFT